MNRPLTAIVAAPVLLILSSASQAVPVLSASNAPDAATFYAANADFLSRADVTQVSFFDVPDQTWNTEEEFPGAGYWDDTLRTRFDESVAFGDGTTVTGFTQLGVRGLAGDTSASETRFYRWIPGTGAPGFEPRAALQISFDSIVTDVRILLGDFGDASPGNPITFDLRVEALLDGNNVFSGLAFDDVLFGNVDSQSLGLIGIDSGFDTVRLLPGFNFDTADLSFWEDVVTIDAIAYQRQVEVPSPASLWLLLATMALLLSGRYRRALR